MLRGHTDYVVSIQFDAEIIASGSFDKTVKVGRQRFEDVAVCVHIPLHTLALLVQSAGPEGCSWDDLIITTVARALHFSRYCQAVFLLC